MTKRMLIDASQPEETRVAVVSGNKLEIFDYEIANRKQLRGSIYLAKVTRVEPSLQAAFVDYGGNRHGFLPFAEIHPDYYQIPVADRQRLLEASRPSARPARTRRPDQVTAPVAERDSDEVADTVESARADLDLDGETGGATDLSDPASPATERAEFGRPAPQGDDSAGDLGGPDEGADPETDRSVRAALGLDADTAPADLRARATVADEGIEADVDAGDDDAGDADAGVEGETAARATDEDPADAGGDPTRDEAAPDDLVALEATADAGRGERHGRPPRGATRGRVREVAAERDEPEDLDDDDTGAEDEEIQRRRREILQRYKIQEVIKHRQIMLVQVSKEERGNKGAAVTTYLSLPGRYCVLMPNSPRGGGVSRKIANVADRRKLKEILASLDVPEGMSVILRTAGMERSKGEIKRDLDYLLRLWDQIRALTLESTAPALVYEEGNLLKRAIRDLYGKEIDELLVSGDDGYRAAREFMRMLMPAHAQKVIQYREEMPLFFRYGVEGQIDAIHDQKVQLKSGGTVVFNQTEALVAIDVNSGKATKERDIEATAFKTNLEAADEIARQLRLRDLGGLIVIDFIDMEDTKHDQAVERRLKDALKLDRARIQVGRISPFGLLEMSRQRLRPSLIESHFETCPTCGGLGQVRTVGSAALSVLRSVEEEGIKGRSTHVIVSVPTPVAFYILNQKRDALAEFEIRYGLRVAVAADDALVAPSFRIERLKAVAQAAAGPALNGGGVPARGLPPPVSLPAEAALDLEDEAEEGEEAEPPETDGRDARGENGRRRRRRGRDRDRDRSEGRAADTIAGDRPAPPRPAEESEAGVALGDAGNDRRKRRRRRRRRGGREEGGRDEATLSAAERGSAAELAATATVTGFTDDGFDDELPAAEGEEERPIIDAGDVGHVPPRLATAEDVPSGDAATAEATATTIPGDAGEGPEAAPSARRGGRRRAKPAAPVEPAGDMEGAARPAAPPEPDAPAPFVDAAPDATPKPKRTRRKAAPTESTPEATGDAAEPPAAAGPDPAEGETPKPRRTTRRRTSAATTDGAAAVTGAAETAAPLAAPDLPVRTGETDPPPAAADPVADGTATTSDAATTEPVAAARAFETVNEAPEKPKKGWWRRLTGE